MVSLLSNHMISPVNDPKWLSKSRRDVYSQTGEDGVIEQILETIPEKDRWCVEFGAWDGLYLSNTRNLIENHGYHAIFIEANNQKFAELQKNYAGNQNVIALNRMVGFTQADNLDGLLKDLPIPSNFDFLSIDIDGNDYHVWNAIENLRPKALCIEFNPTIPLQVPFIQPADISIMQGCSLRALIELGKKKQYELVIALPFNAFFVDSRYFPLFKIENNDPAILWIDQDMITYLFSGYDGTMFIRGSGKMPWHGIGILESRVQQLPRFLRKYPDNYSPIQRRLFDLFCRLFHSYRNAKSGETRDANRAGK